MRFAPFSHRVRDVLSSLRFRLTVWNTAVVLLFVVLTLWGLHKGLGYALWNEADKQLAEDAREAVETYERNWPDLPAIGRELNRKARSHTDRSFHVRIFDAERKLLWTSAEGAPPVPFLDEHIDSGVTPVLMGRFRLVHIQTTKPWVPVVTIRVGISAELLEGHIAKITRQLLIAGSVALLISPLGGWWLAGRATRPLAQIIDTTNRLRPNSLAERLPVRGTRDELDRLSSTINGFLDRIAAYLQQSRDFTASAAHELRSPLAAIQNLLEVALNSDRSVEEYKDLLGELLDECAGLRGLVNQLMLLAESDSGRLQIASAPVPLDLLVRRACEMFSGVAEGASVELRIARLDRAAVRGDSGRLRQVVNNLLDNAIKYTRAGGAVTVSLAGADARGQVRLAVRDTGVGISEEYLPYVFDRFFRGDRSRDRDRRTRGLGLGLAICQSIVAAHSGQIEVESAVERGTTFTVVLPAMAGAAERLDHDEGAGPGNARQESRSAPVTPVTQSP